MAVRAANAFTNREGGKLPGRMLGPRGMLP